jgi:hypothetical protein
MFRAATKLQVQKWFTLRHEFLDNKHVDKSKRKIQAAKFKNGKSSEALLSKFLAR